MAKFRKKPIVIDAHQAQEPTLIHTLEGDVKVQPGNWIITGVEGEKYSCKDSIFKTTYEPIQDQTSKTQFVKAEVQFRKLRNALYEIREISRAHEFENNIFQRIRGIVDKTLKIGDQND